ncbi:hypothetical protein ACT3T2_13200 [Psychrobacter sp. 364]|uniref:hypothetical protein n=1 Tax=Psychrobacter sp. 364 TaxID=3457730 RepID=UPI00403736B3
MLAPHCSAATSNQLEPLPLHLRDPTPSHSLSIFAEHNFGHYRHSHKKSSLLLLSCNGLASNAPLGHYDAF